jgi:hypothetical protein
LMLMSFVMRAIGLMVGLGRTSRRLVGSSRV